MPCAAISNWKWKISSASDHEHPPIIEPHRAAPMGRALPPHTRPRAAGHMGNRLSKIYTRTGDDGTTGLGDGSRVRKDSLRIEAIGAVDELNSALGVLAAEPLDEDIAALLTRIQHTLFDLGGELSVPGFTLVTAGQVTALEQSLDGFNEHLPPLKDFILPGGARAASLCHVARAVSRRAERAVVSLAQEESVADPVRHYLNRLSDLLFVLCRELNRRAGRGDVLWQKATPQARGA